MEWGEDSPLLDFLERQFPRPRNELYHLRDSLLEPEFTAANLARRRGVRIMTTKNLRNHLLYDISDPINKKLYIYPLRLCLLAQKRSTLQLLPDSVIDETIESLTILFPPDNQHTRRYVEHWLPDLLRYADYPFWPEIDNFHNNHLSDFSHWRERLSEIYNDYKEPATTFKQKLLDIRNPVEWFNFWGAAVTIVISTILFGIITSTTAILSTVYTREALLIARDAAASAASTAKACASSTCGVAATNTLGIKG